MKNYLSSSKIKLIPAWLLISLFLICIEGTFQLALAQNNESPRATLRGWENQQRLFIKDRANNHGGFYYDRGLFRMTTQPMGPEYYIDIFTYQFTYFEDYEWFETKNGVRSFMGSLDSPRLVIRNEIKNTIDFSENGEFIVHAYQHEDNRAKRGLLTVNYNYRLGERHTIGILQTLGQEKTDLDATLSYSYGSREAGLITTEFTLLDYGNNIVSDLTGKRDGEFEVRHVYSRKPYLYTLRMESPQIGIFRGEAMAAYQPRAEAKVIKGDYHIEDNTVQDYIMQDWVNYQAALLEAEIPGGAVGIVYQRTFARMERAPAAGSDYELDYGNRQVQQRGGIYFTYRWRSFNLEQWFWIEKNQDQQFDENPEAYVAQDPNSRISRYPFNFREIRRFNKTRLHYKPDERLLSVYLEFNGDWRNPRADNDLTDAPDFNYWYYYRKNTIVPGDQRLTLGVGFQFTDNAHLTLGVSFDIDGDVKGFADRRRLSENPPRKNYDGGFARFQFIW